MGQKVSSSTDELPNRLNVAEGLLRKLSDKSKTTAAAPTPAVIYFRSSEVGLVVDGLSGEDWHDLLESLTKYDSVNLRTNGTNTSTLRGRVGQQHIQLEKLSGQTFVIRLSETKPVGRLEQNSTLTVSPSAVPNRDSEQSDLLVVGRPEMLQRAAVRGQNRTRQLQGLLAQIQSVSGLFSLHPDKHRLSGTIRVLQNKGQPHVISSFTPPDVSPPAIGPLASKDKTPAIFRVSSQPQQLFDYCRSLLPPRMRQQSRRMLKLTTSRLKLDLQRDILENLYGHFLIAIHDFQDLNWTSLLDISATSKTLLIPIRRREPIRRALDIGTQLSQGKLSRQSEGNHLQYAWIEQGELKFAILLTEQFVILGDSPVAFDRGMAYFEQKQSWSPERKQREARWKGLTNQKDTFSGHLNFERLPPLPGASLTALQVKSMTFRSRVDDRVGLTELTLDFKKPQADSSASR